MTASVMQQSVNTGINLIRFNAYKYYHAFVFKRLNIIIQIYAYMRIIYYKEQGLRNGPDPRRVIRGRKVRQ